MKIRIKYHNQNCKITKLGDWIDLRAAETVTLHAPRTRNSSKVHFEDALISLGVSMELPKHMEANIVPRSSTYGQYYVMQANHMGVIDNKYCGDNDIWKMRVVAFDDTIIHESDRICQFRIRPTQNAPWWVKLKWFFNSKIEFVEVKSLGNEDRGGFGSTNNKNN